MRLYFTDPAGSRLAIDTERRQFCADYITPETIIDDGHRYIKVADAAALHIVEREAEFCGYEYSGDFLQGRRPAALYAEGEEATAAVYDSEENNPLLLFDPLDPNAETDADGIII